MLFALLYDMTRFVVCAIGKLSDVGLFVSKNFVGQCWWRNIRPWTNHDKLVTFEITAMGKKIFTFIITVIYLIWQWHVCIVDTFMLDSHYRFKPSCTELAYLCIHHENCAGKNGVKRQYQSQHSPVWVVPIVWIRHSNGSVMKNFLSYFYMGMSTHLN